MKHYLQFGVATFVAIFMLAIALTPSPVNADNHNKIEAADQECDTNADGSVKVNIVEGLDCSKGKDTQTSLFKPDENGNSLFKTVTNVLLFLIGAISVIMLIIGGFRYVISGGDSTQIANAKNTILYAVIGIVVALLAYAIVNFVVSSFTK